MKQFQASVHNIQEDILGIITNKPVLLERNRYLFIGRTEKGKPGYAATLSFSKEVSGSNPVVYNIPEKVELNNGDVVLVTPSGLCTVLYEIASAHNAIMATERCNHRCIMCPQPPIVQEKDKTEFNLRLIDLFDSSTQEVGITGGEPTLIGDNLFKLIRHIQKRLPHSAISILSNGVRFADKEYAKQLALCNHHDIQIDIPLFSDIAEIHNHIVGAKTFYKTVQGLYNLALFRQRIGLRVVVHKQTYNRLPQLADYIYHNFPFVCQVAFMQMETIGLAESNIEKLWIDPFDYQNELREAVLLLRDRGIPSFVYNAQLCILPEDIREFAVQSISDWKDIYIDECSECECKGSCAGFFASNRNHHSSHIKALTEPINKPICLT
jgi:His-Xaa-Ser system radical SAM maturase HxsC